MGSQVRRMMTKEQTESKDLKETRALKYERFEDLPVGNAAVEMAVRVYAITKDRAFAGPGDLSSQIRRAALSVSNNIAEGFERGTTAELLNFLYIARGSAGEMRSSISWRS